MKKLIILSLMIITNSVLWSQRYIPLYHTGNDFLLTSPGAMGTGLYGYDNPAMLNYLHQPDVLFAWSDQQGRWNDFNKWGLFGALPHLGFGMIRESQPGTHLDVTDYRIAAGFGSQAFSLGAGYGWSGGNTDHYNRSGVWTLGFMLRPMRYVSVGAIQNLATAGGHRQTVADVAVRPLGHEMITLFMDWAYQNKKAFDRYTYSFGAALEFLPGIRFTGRYFENKTISAGVQFSLGRAGLSSQGYFDKKQNHQYNTYAVRLGAYDRNIFRSYIFKKNQYVKYTLNTEIKYQRYLLFDKSLTLIRFFEQMDYALKDPNVSGVALNLSGIDISREAAWEFREKLSAFRAAGKHVIIYFDNAGLTVYHLASVADRVVMDPMGMMLTEGFIMGRTFMRGTLEKLGIGYDEWRFFKYKSAMEALSRDSMSAGDREQRQAIIDDMYQLVRADICRSRNLSEERFDELINNVTVFLPQDALDSKLVDAIGRWEDVEKLAEKLENKKQSFIKPSRISESQLPKDDCWGEDPGVAVVYALGACAMDEGINARVLTRIVEKIAKDRRIKAVVIRVDSPGGDALASDLVAEAMKTCRKVKPVIISQGSVAASGGYWLSIYADTIVAAPNTITGSIGVIGGWLYNKGLKEKLGMTTDYVKKGDHADLGFGMTLPLVGLGLPDRNLSDQERLVVESKMKALYAAFIRKVADGRKRPVHEIESIAQGRVWSGTDGKTNGLVDVLGGLDKAIAIAKERAGIPKDQRVTLYEFPKPEWMNPNMFSLKLFGMQSLTAGTPLEELKFRMQNNGRPMPMLPMDFNDGDQTK